MQRVIVSGDVKDAPSDRASPHAIYLSRVLLAMQFMLLKTCFNGNFQRRQLVLLFCCS
jgi:hypothetical protein